MCFTANLHPLWEKHTQPLSGRNEQSPRMTFSHCHDFEGPPAVRKIPFCFLLKTSSVLSCSVMSDSLKPHGLEHARLPCLLGASVRNSAHGKGHEEGGFGIRKGGIEPQETPCSRASTPKPGSAYFTVLCSHLYL